MADSRADTMAALAADMEPTTYKSGFESDDSREEVAAPKDSKCRDTTCGSTPRETPASPKKNGWSTVRREAGVNKEAKDKGPIVATDLHQLVRKSMVQRASLLADVNVKADAADGKVSLNMYCKEVQDMVKDSADDDGKVPDDMALQLLTLQARRDAHTIRIGSYMIFGLVTVVTVLSVTCTFLARPIAYDDGSDVMRNPSTGNAAQCASADTRVDGAGRIVARGGGTRRRQLQELEELLEACNGVEPSPHCAVDEEGVRTAMGGATGDTLQTVNAPLRLSGVQEAFFTEFQKHAERHRANNTALASFQGTIGCPSVVRWVETIGTLLQTDIKVVHQSTYSSTAGTTMENAITVSKATTVGSYSSLLNFGGTFGGQRMTFQYRAADNGLATQKQFVFEALCPFGPFKWEKQLMKCEGPPVITAGCTVKVLSVSGVEEDWGN